MKHITYSQILLQRESMTGCGAHILGGNSTKKNILEIPKRMRLFSKVSLKYFLVMKL